MKCLGFAISNYTNVYTMVLFTVLLVSRTTSAKLKHMILKMILTTS